MRRYLYSDEAGCFAFLKNSRASKYFIVCNVEMPDATLGNDLLALRREMVWSKQPLLDYFHACEDKQVIRDEVYKLIRGSKLSVSATILEKSKAQVQVRSSDARFYKYAWYFHLSGVAPKMNLKATDQVVITTASVGTKKGQVTFSDAVNDVVRQRMLRGEYRTHFCSSASDPCLQIADYCTWAIQRKWERGDSRSYDLIAHLVNHEYEAWKHGMTHYY